MVYRAFRIVILGLSQISSFSLYWYKSIVPICLLLSSESHLVWYQTWRRETPLPLLGLTAIEWEGWPQRWLFQFPYYKLSVHASQYIIAHICRFLISHLIRDYRTCSSYMYFILRANNFQIRFIKKRYVMH